MKRDRRTGKDRREIRRTGGAIDRIADTTHQVLRKHAKPKKPTAAQRIVAELKENNLRLNGVVADYQRWLAEERAGSGQLFVALRFALELHDHPPSGWTAAETDMLDKARRLVGLPPIEHKAPSGQPPRPQPEPPADPGGQPVAPKYPPSVPPLLTHIESVTTP